MSEPTPLVVSTRNPNKITELRALLGGLQLQLVTAASCGVPEVEETADTLAGNAALKARAAFFHTGLPSLADDTGLCVAALNGAPGVHSARFSGPDATYEKNRNLLLERMQDVDDADRGAVFVTCLALVVPASLGLVEEEGMEEVVCADGTRGLLTWVEGRAEGRILRVPRGPGSFGYDPLFFYPPLDKTFAELTREEKNAVSHRGRAYRALRERLNP